jgi:hypothetical protein
MSIVNIAGKGDRILYGQPMPFKFCKMAKVRPGVPAHKACAIVIHIYTSENKKPVVYKDHHSTSKSKLVYIFIKVI